MSGDFLVVDLVETFYNAAGKPQGGYSFVVATTIRLHSRSWRSVYAGSSALPRENDGPQSQRFAANPLVQQTSRACSRSLPATPAGSRARRLEGSGWTPEA